MDMTVRTVEEYGIGPKVYYMDYASEITIRSVVKIEQLVPVYGNGIWREERSGERGHYFMQFGIVAISTN